MQVALVHQVVTDLLAETGASSLEDIKEHIESTRVLEGDYEPLHVPSAFVAVDKKIRRCKRAHDSSLDEMLAYWKDSNTQHIKVGTAAMQSSAVLENDCIKELNTPMTAIASKRRQSEDGRRL